MMRYEGLKKFVVDEDDIGSCDEKYAQEQGFASQDMSMIKGES